MFVQFIEFSLPQDDRQNTGTGTWNKKPKRNIHTVESHYLELGYLEHPAISNSNLPLALVFQSFTIGYLELPAISNCFLFPLSVRDSGIQLYILKTHKPDNLSNRNIIIQWHSPKVHVACNSYNVYIFNPATLVEAVHTMYHRLDLLSEVPSSPPWSPLHTKLWYCNRLYGISLTSQP